MPPSHVIRLREILLLELLLIAILGLLSSVIVLRIVRGVVSGGLTDRIRRIEALTIQAHLRVFFLRVLRG